MSESLALAKGLLKLDPVVIDNIVFRVHYKATVIVLIACSMLVFSNQYMGNPISCIVDGIPTESMNNYCWIYSTFSDQFEDAYNTDEVHQNCTGNVGQKTNNLTRPASKGKPHKYYQWIWIVLLFQAIFFYVPYFVWKNYENCLLKKLVVELNLPILSEESKFSQKKSLVQYFVSHLRFQNHYAYVFFFCETLNCANVVLQILFMDFFLDGSFSSYSSDVFRNKHERQHPMSKVFPKMIDCIFYKRDSSEAVQLFKGVCVLPLNIVNEKIYGFLWYWFVMVFFLTLGWLLYRGAIVFWPKIQQRLLSFISPMSPIDKIETVCAKCQIGDWFILYLLGRNMEPIIYKEIISDIAKELNPEKEPSDTISSKEPSTEFLLSPRPV